MPERKGVIWNSNRSKAAIVFLMVSVFLLSMATFVFADSEPTFGNVAGGEDINVTDVVLVMRKALEMEELTFRQRELADVNNDGVINVSDVVLIMRKALALDETFPVEAAVDEDAIIIVSLYHDQVDGFFWPADSALTIKVGSLQRSVVTDEEGSFTFRHEDMEIKPGQTVVVSIGGIRKVHIVRDLNITKIDSDNDVIRGTVEAGSRVEVRVFEPGIDVFSDYPARFPVSTNASIWHADFSEATGDEKHYQSAYNIGIGDIGDVRFVDLTGDATVVFWQYQEANFSVFPEGNYINGGGWTPVSEITVTIGDDKYTAESAPVDGFFWIEDVTVEAGDVVVVTDGVTTMQHVVTGLLIESVNSVAKTAAGTAAPGSEVEVYLYKPHEGYGPPTELDSETVTAALVTGNWSVTFDVDEITEDMFVEAVQSDENNNSTVINKYFGAIPVD